MPISKDDKIDPSDNPTVGKLAGDRCGEGMTFTEGKCVPTGGKGRMCEVNSRDDCEHQCKLGHVQSCTALGRIYLDGIGVQKKPLQALEPLQTACSAGADAKACLLLADLYKDGARGVPPDEVNSRLIARRASWILQKACDEAEAEACHLVGTVYGQDRLLPRDKELAKRAYESACDGGFAGACYALAQEAYTLDKEQRLALLKRSCAGGYGRACVDTGRMLEADLPKEKKGEGSTEIVGFYDRACDAKYAPGCAEIAKRFALGTKGAEKSDEKSKEHWREWGDIVKSRCDANELSACELIAEVYFVDQPGQPKDYSQANAAANHWLKTHRKDCYESSDPNACVRYYNAWIQGKLPSQGNYWFVKNPDTAKAALLRYIKLREPDCSARNPSLCVDLASHSDRLLGLPEKARQYLEIACSGDKNGGMACWSLASLYLDRRIEFDPIAAELWSRRACEAGVMHGCMAQAALLERGEGVAKDERRAFSIYRFVCKASSMTNAAGCSKKEQMLLDGRGTPKDAAAAFSSVHQRCTNWGEPNACISLGYMYEKGVGTKTDHKKAEELFGRYCSQRNRAGCALLGNYYESGKLGARDPKKALEMYSLACPYASVREEYRNACVSAAHVYLGRALGKPDPAKATEFLDKACRAGDAAACAEQKKLQPPPAAPATPAAPDKPAPGANPGSAPGAKPAASPASQPPNMAPAKN
jgi:TPR repeat protein